MMMIMATFVLLKVQLLILTAYLILWWFECVSCSDFSYSHYCCWCNSSASHRCCRSPHSRRRCAPSSPPASSWANCPTTCPSRSTTMNSSRWCRDSDRWEARRSTADPLWRSMSRQWDLAPWTAPMAQFREVLSWMIWALARPSDIDPFRSMSASGRRICVCRISIDFKSQVFPSRIARAQIKSPLVTSEPVFERTWWAWNSNYACTW